MNNSLDNIQFKIEIKNQLNEILVSNRYNLKDVEGHVQDFSWQPEIPTMGIVSVYDLPNNYVLRFVQIRNPLEDESEIMFSEFTHSNHFGIDGKKEYKYKFTVFELLKPDNLI